MRGWCVPRIWHKKSKKRHASIYLEYPEGRGEESMNSTSTRAVWLEVNTTAMEATIADAITNWCSSNPDVEIKSIKVYQEHETKYKALVIYTI
jgi:hypothetical protein